MTLPTGTLRNESTGEVLSLEETTEIGRSSKSGLPITDPRVSRRHAMIRRQDDGFWFFDLGSVNGSYINERRVTTSQRLSTGDVLQIADRHFYFEEDNQGRAQAQTTLMANQTIAEVKSREVVLLVSDIQNFTSLSEQLSPDQLAPIMGSWYARTEEILTRHGGTLDKFIGDCLLAYWLGTSTENRLAALKAAAEMQQACVDVSLEHQTVLESTQLAFGSGAAVHLGTAAYGSFVSKEFTLIGDSVNLAFRLETLTRTLGERVLVSAELLKDWEEGTACCRDLGSHSVKGRVQKIEVFALAKNPAADGNG